MTPRFFLARWMPGILLVALLLPGGGCSSAPQKKSGKSVLAKPRATLETVGLDIFFVRLPAEERATYDQVWARIDEQAVAAEVRRDLGENGFRVGLIGSQLPEPVLELLDASSKQNSEEEPSEPSEVNKSTPLTGGSIVKFDDSGGVRIRHLQLRPGRRGEVIASPLYEKLPVLVREGDQIRGRTYEKCQGVFALEVNPLGDGRVQVKMVPEIQFGENQQRPFMQQTQPLDGIWRLPSGRPREAFQQLTFQTTLSPGEMVAVSSFADHDGSLGHHFCTTEESGKQEHKLLLVRVAQSQLDDLFVEEPASTTAE